jgi:hypothetical protein
VVSEHRKSYFLFVVEKRGTFSAMPLRRRDRPMSDPVVEREMHELRARLDAMETTQRCTIDIGISARLIVKMTLDTKKKS